MVKKITNKELSEDYLEGWKDSLKEIKRIAGKISSEASGDINYNDLIEKIDELKNKFGKKNKNEKCQ
jgi:hypothetical protein